MELLSNREIAILIWFGVAFVFSARKTDLRKTFAPILKCLLNRIILSVLFLYLLYVGFMIFCLEGWGLWDSGQIKNTIIWTSVVGLVAIFKVADAKKETFFEDWIFDNFKIAVVLGFIVSFYTFHILIELILQPFIVIVVMMSALSESKEEHKAVNVLCDWVLAIIGLYVLWWSGNKIWADPSAFLTLQTVQDFATPIMLSLAFTPFLYVLFIYATYERVFSVLVNVTDDKKLLRYMKFNAMMSFGTDTDFLDRWRRNVLLNKPEDRESARKIATNLLELKNIERDPPEIEPSEGWSPYEAQKFLIEHGITVRDYHEQYGDWYANGNPLKVGNETILSDTICYYIAGDIRAAKKLKLHLNVNYPDENEVSEKAFLVAALTLFEKAISENIPEVFTKIIEIGEGEFMVNEYLRVFASGGEWDVGKSKGYDKEITFQIISQS